MEETEKDPRKILFRNFLIQIVIIVYFTGTWLTPLLIGFVEFNIGYFIFMFISIIISAIIILRSKTVQKQSYPIVFTKKFANILKILTDIVANVIGKPNQHPQVQEFKDIIQKVIIWNLRDGRVTPEFDQEVIDDAETYIFDKLFPKEEIGEEK